MTNQPPFADHDLWAQFQSASLPASAWTHQAHLRVAFLYLREHSLDDAHILMRVAIIRLNAFHGLVETVERGYHETLTRVWLLLVASAMKATPQVTSAIDFATEHAASLTKEAPLRHYSRERIFSRTARAQFVAPDLAPLP